ncbi:MAG: carbohydrate-binding domain-containing protein [Clostridiales bacterium]|nr:carbohydrate-binding domain-containing protein [Clostridiales bacterium]
MKQVIRRAVLILTIIAMLAAFCSCGSDSDGGSVSDSGSSDSEDSIESFSYEINASPVTDYTGDTAITLEGDTASVSGSGAKYSAGDVIITAGGSYTISGILYDGRIVVNADGEDVTLIFSNAEVSCSYSAAVFVYKADSVTLAAEEGTVNTFSDGSSYSYSDSYSSEADEEPNACIFSKQDMVISGEGTFEVNGSFNNGIVSKDTLLILNTNITVNAANNGINGKDSNIISNSVINITCSGDGLRSTNDTDSSLGYIAIEESDVTIVSGEDGMQAETVVSISGGTYSITAGGGSSSYSAYSASSDTSTKGIKAGTQLYIDSGTFTIDSCDDAVHSNTDATISGGTFTISSGDDGIHADEDLIITGGNITIAESYEGLEGTLIKITGGTIYITASDDGLNAAGGNDSSGYGGFDTGGFGQMGTGTGEMEITGGYLVVNAGGDGVDSNGTIVMTGGTVIVFGPTDSANGAIDYETSFSMEGGTLLAMGSSGMAESPSSVSGVGIDVTFSQTISAGTYIALVSDSNTFVFQAQKTMSNLIFISPDLSSGESVTVYYGGSFSGTVTDGIGSNGTYTSGTELTDLTLSSGLSSYGSAGMGGMNGGMNRGGWF